jgi:cysteine synthase A
MRIYDSVNHMIGQTPLVRLRTASELTGNVVAGKTESRNPGGSVKDRIAWAMVQRAELDGLLLAGGTIVEPTSGNTGIGLAMVAASRGYRLVLVMPESSSLERRLLFAAYGAEVHLTAGGLGMRGAITHAEALLKSLPSAIMLRQFDNAANPEVHAATTGPEIWNDTDGKVDAVVCGIGTGGTATGVGRYLKRLKPSVQIIAIEPAESQVLRGQTPGPHKIQGIGAGFIPSVLDLSLLDDVVPVSSEVAFDTARTLTATEGILIGISGGAAVAGAQSWLLRQGWKDRVVVVILPDSGERYLSTGMFQGEDKNV